ncbi:MAG: ribulose-phosphate 3-epimerase [bacterium]
MIKIAPSILSADFSCLSDEIKKIEKGGVDLIHIDVMDGHFVPNITIGPLVVEAIKKVTDIPLDVHLMINNPDQFIESFIKAGSDIITVHVEVCYHLHRTITLIKEKGIKCGVVLNPTTSLATLEHIISEIDMVLLMSVNPGFGGQRFITEVLNKISKLRNIIIQRKLDIDLEVDGGVKLDNISQIVTAGANVIVAGSAIFGAKDPVETIKQMRQVGQLAYREWLNKEQNQ